MKSAISILLLVAVVSVAATALAEPVRATEDVTARRWVDNADVKAGEVSSGDRLDVLFREEGWVRVRLAGPGAGFGWVPETAVAAIEDEPGFDMGLPTGLDLPGRRPGLDLPGGFPGGTTLPGGGALPGGTSLPPLNLEIE